MSDRSRRIFAELALVALGGVLLAIWSDLQLPTASHTLSTRALGLGVGLYLVGHGVRAARTAVVLGPQVRSLRAVVLAHLVSAPWGLFPLKLGELVRMAAVGRASTSLGWGVGAIWVERTFDASVLLVVALATLATRPDAVQAALPVAIASAGLLLATSIAAFTLPENVGMAKMWLIQRPSRPWTLSALAALDQAGDVLLALRSLMRGKVTTLAGLTLAIWTLEFVGVGLVIAPVKTLDALVPLMAAITDVMSLGQVDPGIVAWRGVVVRTLGGLALIGGLGGALSWTADRMR